MCMCTCVCVHVYIMHKFVCVCMCVSTCVCECVYLHVYVCMHACVCVKEMFYLTMHSTHLWLYGIRHMVKDHSYSERGNPLPPHGLLFLISSKDSFICIIPQTG